MNQELVASIADEVAFWKRFVTTPRFLNNWVNAPVNTEPVAKDIEHLLEPHAMGSALDVGSGAVSVLKGRFARLVAVDPLAPFYQQLFDYRFYNIEPPHAIFGEDLDKRFGANTFDVVHISNALDHCQNPPAVVRNMIELTKPGGVTIIQGFVNEGTTQSHQGMHQFDIEPVGETMLEIRDKTQKVVLKLYVDEVTVETFNMKAKKQKDWFIAYIKKKG